MKIIACGHDMDNLRAELAAKDARIAELEKGLIEATAKAIVRGTLLSECKRLLENWPKGGGYQNWKDQAKALLTRIRESEK